MNKPHEVYEVIHVEITDTDPDGYVYCDVHYEDYYGNTGVRQEEMTYEEFEMRFSDFA